MKTILVLTDHSFSAFNAARYAVSFASTFESSTVVLYHSYNYLASSAIELAYISAGFESLDSENKQRMVDLEDNLEPFRGSNTLLLTVSNDRELSAGISQISRDHQIDLIVAGSKNRTSLGMLMVGSAILDLIDKINLPFLVVPTSYIYEPVMCAVLAADLGDVNRLPHAVVHKFIEAYGCKLLVLNVSPKEGEINRDEIWDIGKLHELLDPMHPEYHYLNDGDISKAIRDFCDEKIAGLMILIHREHSFIHKVFYKNIEREIAVHSNVPALFLRQNSNVT